MNPIEELETKRRQISGESAATHAVDPATAAAPRITPAGKAADRLSQLRRAAETAQRRRTVELPDLSRAYNARIEVVLTDVQVNEILGSGLLPGDSRQVVNKFVQRSEDMTANERQKVGMIDLAKQIAEEDYGGDTMAVYSGLMQLSRAMAVLGVKEFYFNGEPNVPPITLTMERDDRDAHSLYVGLLTDRDANIISGTLWQNLEAETVEAAPFPGQVHSAGPVPTFQNVERSAFRPDGV